MRIGGLAGKPLTRPPATLPPSDGERDGVRGVWSIPPFVFAKWYKMSQGLPSVVIHLDPALLDCDKLSMY